MAQAWRVQMRAMGRVRWGSVAGWGRNLMASLSQWSVSQGTGEGVYEDV